MQVCAYPWPLKKTALISLYQYNLGVKQFMCVDNEVDKSLRQ